MCILHTTHRLFKTKFLLQGWVLFQLLQIQGSLNIYPKMISQMKRTPLFSNSMQNVQEFNRVLKLKRMRWNGYQMEVSWLKNQEVQAQSQKLTLHSAAAKTPSLNLLIILLHRATLIS